MRKFITGLIDFWANEWKYRRCIFLLEMGGAITSIIGVMWLAIDPVQAPMLTIYIFWTIGSVLFFISSILREAPWGTFLTTFYIISDIIALHRLLF